MATAQQNRERRDKEHQEQDRRNSLIGDRVIHALGKPGGLYKVDVRPLWGKYYRVNIMIEGAAGSAKIADSFFLETDSDGSIVASSPKIARKY